MGSSIDAQLKLIGDISKMVGGKTLEQAMKDDRKRTDREFHATAGWSFDPTKFGFKVLKRYHHSARREKVGQVPFEWYAEKIQKRKSGTTVHTYHIRKKNGEDNTQYLIRKTTVDYASEWDKPAKLWDCTIPNQDGAKEALVEVKAVR